MALCLSADAKREQESLPLKPNICILTETFYPQVGGGETQARVLAEGMASRGYAVSVVPRRSDPVSKKTEYLGSVRIYRLAPVGSALPRVELALEIAPTASRSIWIRTVLPRSGRTPSNLQQKLLE